MYFLPYVVYSKIKKNPNLFLKMLFILLINISIILAFPTVGKHFPYCKWVQKKKKKPHKETKKPKHT